MNSVLVGKNELLALVKKNRAAHREIFEEAIANYRKKVIKELDKMIRDAKGGRRIQRFISLVEPVDQTKEYDRVIKMLEMSVEENIELSQEDFACYVLDEWGWKQQFGSSVQGYLSQSKLASLRI